MEIACLDLEGVLIPEIWIGVAEKTGIDELLLTTRDIPVYDDLMRRRLAILEKHNLRYQDIQEVVTTLQPLPGAVEFVDWLRQNFQLLILSDTFYEFSQPLMAQLGWPALLCHKLQISEDGRIVDFTIRQKDPKRCAVRAMQELNYRVIAAGDSYNDTTMLAQADAGILFRAPDRVIEEFKQFPAVTAYDELRAEFITASVRDLA